MKASPGKTLAVIFTAAARPLLVAVILILAGIIYLLAGSMVGGVLILMGQITWALRRFSLRKRLSAGAVPPALHSPLERAMMAMDVIAMLATAFLISHVASYGKIDAPLIFFAVAALLFAVLAKFWKKLTNNPGRLSNFGGGALFLWVILALLSLNYGLDRFEPTRVYSRKVSECPETGKALLLSEPPAGSTFDGCDLYRGMVDTAPGTLLETVYHRGGIGFPWHRSRLVEPPPSGGSAR